MERPAAQTSATLPAAFRSARGHRSELDDGAVESQLFTAVGRSEPPERAPIDLEWVRREMRKTGVTNPAATEGRGRSCASGSCPANRGGRRVRAVQ